MITIVVHYGNHNKYSIELPPDTKLGYLSWYLTKLIDQEPSNILYLVMGGCVIGNNSLSFSKTLAECNIINNKWRKV